MEESVEQLSSISESRIKVSIYFLEEPNFNELACIYTILHLNFLQSVFEFQFPQNLSCLHLYLFNWDRIPGSNNEMLIDFLKENFDIDWVKTAKIEKIDNGKTIRVSGKKNSLSLSLNNERTEVNLEIDNVRADGLIAKMENGELKIYLDSYPLSIKQKKSIDSLIKINLKFRNLPNFCRFKNFLNENNFSKKAAYHIGIINKSIESNLFFLSWENMSIITTNNWDKLFSPPSVFEYIIHCLNASLVQMVTSIESHSETRGCCLDYTYFKVDDKVDITLGYICDDCSAKIKEKCGEEFLKAINTIASRAWIGRVDEPNSFSYNLKKYYHVDIEKDSGFIKSFWEKAKEHFPELPTEIIKVIITAVVSTIFTLITLYLTGLLKIQI